MISNVSLAGREGMITKGLNAVVDRYEYLGAGKMYSKAEIEAAKNAMMEAVNHRVVPKSSEARYTSPFSAISSDIIELNGRKVAASDSLSYALSHGVPEKEAHLNTMI